MTGGSTVEVFEKSGEYYDLIYGSYDHEKECDALEKIVLPV